MQYVDAGTDFSSVLLDDLYNGRVITRPLVNIKTGNEHQTDKSHMYFIPSDKEEMVEYLFDMSLGKRVCKVNRVVSDRAKEFPPDRVFAYEIYLEDSPDGTTNITPEFLDMILHGFPENDCK